MRIKAGRNPAQTTTTTTLIKMLNRHLIPILLLLAFVSIASAQTLGEKQTVFCKVFSFTSNSVTFNWSNFSVQSTDVFRKEISGTRWTKLATLSENTVYTDYTISSGVEYEYKFEVNTNNDPPIAYGYLAFGIQVPQKTTRGNILVMVDNRFEESLAVELANLSRDLISDGWTPFFTYVNMNSSVPAVKSTIEAYDELYGVNSIYLIGHIPVPYSGNLFPDGHLDHRGAWPTDLYYSSDSRNWSDNSVNYTNNTRPANSNTLGDGKFDQSQIPAKSFASISRVDFYNLPTLDKDEETLLRNYLNEASKYKNARFQANNKAVYYDGFQTFDFSANAYRNFNSLVGIDSMQSGNTFSTLSSETMKWMYHCGPGTDTSVANSEGSTTISTLKNTNYKGIFSMVLGSYFADWNTEDNFMRSLLADGKMLNTCWVGRPHWFFHQMGLNTPISQSATYSITNGMQKSTEYAPFMNGGLNYSNLVHMNLLGDPTLRNNYTTPLDSFKATSTYNGSNQTLSLSWSSDKKHPNTTYDIYYSNGQGDPYVLLTSTQDTTASVEVTPYVYILYAKPVFLDTTLSGSYYNNSTGNFITINATGTGTKESDPLPVNLISFDVDVCENEHNLFWSTAQEADFIQFEVESSTDLNTWKLLSTVKGTNTSQVATYTFSNQQINLGNTYYRLKLVDLNGSHTHSEIRVAYAKSKYFNIYPNPTPTNRFQIQIADKQVDLDALKIYNQSGNLVDFSIDRNTNIVTLDYTSKGLYFIKMGLISKKLLVQ